MNTFMVFFSYVDGREKLVVPDIPEATVICADGGRIIAAEHGIEPDVMIGDFDSSPLPGQGNIIKLPRAKNLTDGEAAIDYAAAHGAERIIFIGGLGGRFDHTMANLGLMVKYALKGIEMSLIDGYNRIRILMPGTYVIPDSGAKYLSGAAFSEEVTGLCMSGVAYPLDDFTLPATSSRCVSNEFAAPEAVISFKTGIFILMECVDA